LTADLIFSIVSAIAALSWVLLIILPRQRWVTTITRFAIPALLASVYVALIVTQWGRSEGGFSSLADVAALFRNPWLLLAGWIHYLAFDLFVGTWEVTDARTAGVSHLLVVPCLILTFLFGPGGLLLYLALRSTRLAGTR